MGHCPINFSSCSIYFFTTNFVSNEYNSENSEIIEGSVVEGVNNVSDAPQVEEVDDLEDQFFIEENFTITTENVKVTFTNRGGDIIGYELLNHQDGEANI